MQAHALRCVLVWTMKEQPKNESGTSAERTSTEQEETYQEGRSGATGRSSGIRRRGRGRDRGGDVCRLFPSDSLFRYDEGVRNDLVSQDDVQPLPPQQITPQLKDLALQFELAAAWCSYPVGKKGEGHITAWACRDRVDAPGARGVVRPDLWAGGG